MPTGIKQNEIKSDYEKGFDEGYKAGIKCYVNDIDLEIDNVKKTIKTLKDYVHENDKILDELQTTLKVLQIIKRKADSSEFL